MPDLDDENETPRQRQRRARLSGEPRLRPVKPRKRKPVQYWALLRTKAGQENYARRNCEAQGYTVFNPRWEPVLNKGQLQAFFPGYIFVLMDGMPWQPLRSTYGVIDIVGGKEGPWRVPYGEIKRLRTMEDDDGVVRTEEQLVAIALAVKQKRKLVAGETVRFIRGGAYKGQAAVYKGVAPGGRINVILFMMGRRTTKQVDRSDVAPEG